MFVNYKTYLKTIIIIKLFNIDQLNIHIALKFLQSGFLEFDQIIYAENKLKNTTFWEQKL